MPINLPSYTLRYMSYELREALAQLTQPQQNLIFRVVFKDKYTGKTLIPASYIYSKKGYVSPDTYYRRGHQDQNGNWHRVGWAHQSAFVAAVELAKRRVLEVDLEDDLSQVAKSKSKARRLSEDVVDTWHVIMRDDQWSAKDRIEAGQRLVDYGAVPADATQATSSDEETWWKSALEK